MTNREILAEIDRRLARAREDQADAVAKWGRHGIWDFFYDGQVQCLEHLRDEIAPRPWHLVADSELAVFG